MKCSSEWSLMRQLNNSHWTEEIQETIILEEMTKTSKSMEKVASEITEKVSEVFFITKDLIKNLSTNDKKFLENGKILACNPCGLGEQILTSKIAYFHTNNNEKNC